MKALIVYVGLVAAGALIAGFIGLYVERHFSSALSLVVFLGIFFANFATCWILTILIIDGSLSNARGRQDQIDVEAEGQRIISARARARM
jgi:hypothetical protein